MQKHRIFLFVSAGHNIVMSAANTSFRRKAMHHLTNDLFYDTIRSLKANHETILPDDENLVCEITELIEEISY